MTAATLTTHHRCGAPERPGARRLPGRLLSRSASLFWICCVGYFALGWYLAVDHGVVVGDALGRVENAASALWSRDPHLAAVGFVWPALPSLAALPLVALDPLWHGFVSFGMAGVVETAVVMALAVEQVRRCSRDLGASQAASTVIAVVFAVNPVIAYYGANGMTEAWLVFFLVATARALVRWLDRGGTTDLVLAGVFPALAYLCRYEALAGGVGCVGLVAVVAHRRGSGSRAARIREAAAAAAVPGFPLAFAFFAAAAASWIIVGSPFEQFTSRYGNSALLRASGGVTTMVHGSLPGFAVSRTTDLAPLLAPVAAVGLLLCGRRRDPRVLGVIVVLGGTIAVMDALFVTRMTFPWLRYYILAIPLCCLLAAAACGNLPKVPGRKVMAAALVLALTPALPTSWRALTSTKCWSESVILPQLLHRDPDSAYWTSRKAAADLDAQDLPQGSVLADLYGTFVVVAASHRPRQFVIPSDRDFAKAMADPQAAHIEYLLAGPDVRVDMVAAKIAALRAVSPPVIAPVAEYRGTDGFGEKGFYQLWRMVRR